MLEGELFGQEEKDYSPLTGLPGLFEEYHAL